MKSQPSTADSHARHAAAMRAAALLSCLAIAAAFWAGVVAAALHPV